MPPRPVKRGTLASIAADLGISRTTVSNAYNHPDQLSPELREKILAAAAARGYSGPDPMARSLRTRRVGSFGVLLTEQLSFAFEDLASIEFLAGLAASSFGKRNSMTLVPVGPHDEDSTQTVQQAVVDGFVVYSVAADDRHLAAARARQLPIVIVDQPYDIFDLPYVGIDDRVAIQPAAQALIDAGHRRVGILTKRIHQERMDGPVTAEQIETAELHVQRARVQGAIEAFEAAGITEVPVISRHFNDHAAAVDAAREMLECHPEVTAILCTTDSMAFGVLDYCAAQGIDVPGQLSVTGFDGVELAHVRGLTTVNQPNRRKGAMVGKILEELVDAYVNDHAPADPTPRVVIPTTFTPGQTVAAPRNSALA
ncbi:LacI family DNA-binding transcriptional regulator [Corynebacterium breve]|uniref:LacI family DNA-binding transcriptional regulator n=1 Tax=Corynebacterium breve TaxID=3049799 RepID=A0ABY8VDC0_9CORY|nr:LacI family DNA-binding transcriptional regulator [Corynebacterium breve]WIM67332.1 LacI family DNA-binding transcriptional regulator [Corynebacterium breve]